MSSVQAAFYPIPTLSTCGSYNITWFLPEPGLTIPGAIMIIQNPTSPFFLSRYLVPGDSFPTNSFFWDPINVPAGQYELDFLAYGASAFLSAEFEVINGTTTDCVKQFAAASGSASSAFPFATSSYFPIVAFSVNTGLTGGAIAGIVIGCLVGIILLLVTLWALIRRRSHRASTFAPHSRSHIWRFEKYFFIGRSSTLPNLPNDSALQTVEAAHVSTVTSRKAPEVQSLNLSGTETKKVIAESDKKDEDAVPEYTPFRADLFDDKSDIRKF